MTRNRKRWTLLGVLLVLTGCSGISGTPSMSGAPAGTGSVSAQQVSDPVARFGYGPDTKSGAKYQPDVVLIGGGPAAIRSVSSDGMVWSMDAAAPGIADLAPGKIMFASSMAVGRVVSVAGSGATREVTLGPVTLPELVAGGSFDLDQDLPASAFQARALPQGEGSIQDTSSDGSMPGGLRAPGLLALAPGDSWDNRGYVAGTPIPVGEWSATPTVTDSVIGVDIVRKQADLIAEADISLTHHGLHVVAVGGLGPDMTFLIKGLNGIRIDLKAGLGPGGSAGSNRKIVAELPLSWDIPITGGVATLGIPVYLRVGMTVSVITALGAKNATVTASADYKLNGDIGILKGSVQAPTMSVSKSLLSSIEGISLTPSGMVAAAKMRLMLGVGIPFAMAGPSAFITVSSGILRGSQTAINPDCRYASLDIKAGFGVSTEVSDWAAKIIEKYTKKKVNNEVTKNLLDIHREQSDPDVAACRIS